MRKDIIILLMLLFVFPNWLFGQSQESKSSLSEDDTQFLMYIDTIQKYMYRNTQIVKETINKCELIVQNSSNISKNSLLKLGTQKVYFEQNQANYLGAYQVVDEYNYLLNDNEVDDKEKGYFNYIKGFTFMNLGDLESAQKTFYALLDNKGETQQDSIHTFNALYSLGQLYSDEGENETAIKYFLQLLDLLKTLKARASSRALVEYELIETYLKINEIDKASIILTRSFQYLKEKKIDLLYPDFLLLKGEIALRQKDYDLAKKIDREIYQMATKEENPIALKNSQLFRAKLFSTQKLFSRSLDIYESLLEKFDSTQLNDRMDVFQKSHIVCNVMGDDSKAYFYSNKLFEIKEKLDAQEKRKQTSYLKIKFESEQKEIENKNLTLEILKKKNQNKVLYIYFLIALFGMLLLFLAFYQKRKYSQKLQEEVATQTKELLITNNQLKTSNKELDEFNNILSHDLKEPLRSIVGFSQLVKKENPANKKIIDYISHIEKSGNQLYDLIHDVSIFQSIKSESSTKPKEINMNLFVEEIKEHIQEKDPSINFKIYYHDLPTIFANPIILKWTFLNLIQNGIKFNKNKIPKIEIRYSKKEGLHFFEFKDNGIGMAPQFHDKVFGMFKRLNSRDVYRGSGLGLSIVQRLMLSINGKVTLIESKVNEGSVFEICFPQISNEIITEENTQLEVVNAKD